MKVLVFNHQRDLSIKSASIKPIIKEVLYNEGFATDELSVYFVSTQEICTLHNDFFEDPTPTDCITFPVDERDEEGFGYHILGEIFICPRTAIEYVQSTHSTDHRAVYLETTLYLVHALLHLIGYDDLEKNTRREMRKAEKRILEILINKKLLLKGGRSYNIRED